MLQQQVDPSLQLLDISLYSLATLFELVFVNACLIVILYSIVVFCIYLSLNLISFEVLAYYCWSLISF